MSKIKWDERGKRLFETGVSHGVLFLLKPNGSHDIGVAWNGLTAVNESSSGGEANPIYADNIKYGNVLSEEIYSATIEAYAYPDEFKKCLGKNEVVDGVILEQQTRKHFSFCYRTKIGNDEAGVSYQYAIHIVYNCTAGLSEASYNSIGETPEPLTYSWEIASDKIALDGYRPTSTIVLDRKKFSESGILNVFRELEDVLYGSADASSQLLMPLEIVNFVELRRNLQDSEDDLILDSNGNTIQTVVFD